MRYYATLVALADDTTPAVTALQLTLKADHVCKALVTWRKKERVTQLLTHLDVLVELFRNNKRREGDRKYVRCRPI